MKLIEYYNGNKTDCLRRLYNAHNIIADINERINNLYASATSISSAYDGMPKNHNPQRVEGIIVELLDLKTLAQKYLKKRATFDYFMSTLNPFYKRLLDLRCENCRSWKVVASELDISTVSAKRIFKRICEKAEVAGLFNTLNA